MSFALFLVLNAILLIRPEDFLPEIAGSRLYLILIVVNLGLALPKIIDQLRSNQLVKQPITVCVLGLLVAAALSNLARGRLDLMWDFVPEFAKVVVYYLLFIAVVDTPARLRNFLGFVVPLVMVVGGLGVLQMHEIIDYEALRPVQQGAFDPELNMEVFSPRMCGPGVFNDPNDICMVLTLGTICALYRGATARNY